MISRILTLLILSSTCAFAQVQLERGQDLLPFPDSAGRAGMAAATVTLEDKSQGILVVGGANFPGRAPWDGGEKVYYSDIVLLRKVDGVWTWLKVGDLPEPVAYAAFAPCKEGLVIAGGVNASGHLKSVYVISAKGAVHGLRPLPTPLAYAASTVDNDRLIVIGGQTSPDATQADTFFGILDLKDPAPKWDVRPWIGTGRILATAGVLDGKLYLMGGCTLAASPEGKPQRTYLQSTRIFKLSSNATDSESASVAGADLPFPLAASCGPAIVRDSRIILLGGDDGSHYGKPPQTHPGQRGDILVYNPRESVFENKGMLATGLATTPVVVLGSDIVAISGETKPGVRTPAMQVVQVTYVATYNWIDGLVLVLALVALGLLAREILRGGLRRTIRSLGDANAPSRAAWIAVGLLFVVAMLNYLDRQLLASMSAPIIRDIPQTSAEFGLLTAIFLFVYSALSPVGGILADRYSRRMVILVSLAVWSAVTWLTGHVTDYRELVIARALMGVSEAFYIPAALALITDYHRGRTRSLATGLHMSGIYLGQALAGVGGYVAEAAGWRLTFAIFGLVGVVYALILIVWLREPSGDSETEIADAESTTEKPRVAEILRGCLQVPAFWLLFAICACASASNWFILSWLPRLLQENFNLSMGEAGTWATMPTSIAKYIAVLGGAVLADRLTVRDPRARSRLASLGFIIAGPMIALTTIVPEGALAIFVGLVIFQGIAQGVLDATMMPILRSYIGGRFAATGYGFLNLAGAGIGGLTVYYGGALKDAGIPLATTLALSGAGLLVCGIALSLLPKPPEIAD